MYDLSTYILYRAVRLYVYRLCRSGEAWAALVAEYLLTYLLPSTRKLSGPFCFWGATLDCIVYCTTST